MRMQRQFLAISLILFLVSMVSVNSSDDYAAYACSCMQPLSPDEELPNYDAVFSGKVTGMEETISNDQVFSSADSILVTLDVDTVWKGEKKDTMTVKTAQSSASCGFYFEEEREYIVYASQYDDEYLEVSLCSRTGLLSDAIEDLQELGPGIPIKSESKPETLPPLKQFKSGISAENIQCKEELRLVIKHDNTPACVKSSSVEKLTDRDWIVKLDYPNHVDVPSLEKLFFTLQGDDQVGSLDKANWDAGPMMTYLASSSSADNNSLILAASSGSNTAYAFDSSQGELIATVSVGETPKGIKIHPDRNIAFVANEGSGTISVIDVVSWKVTKEIEVGDIPHNIRFDSQGDTAYVTLQGEDKIAIIDVPNLKMMDSIPVEKLPHNLDLSPDDRYLYTANIGTSDVAVIDLQTKEIIKRIKVSTGHHGIDVSNDGKRIYVSGIGSDKVNVIDATSLELIKQIDVGQGPHGIRTSEDGSKVFVGITGTNEIVIIDTEALNITERISVGNTPFWLATPGNQ